MAPPGNSSAASGVVLDTSGVVKVLLSNTGGEKEYGLYRWDHLSPFAQGYVEALFASLIEAYRGEAGIKIGDKVRVHTDEVGTVSRLIAGKTKCVQVSFADGSGGQFFPFECSVVAPGFSDIAPETLAAILKDCEAAVGRFVANAAECGAAFWRLRQRGDYPHALPPLTPYLDDTGKVRLREAGQ